MSITDEEVAQETKPLTLSAAEASEILGISRTAVYDLARKGEIKSVKLGTHVRILRRPLLEMLGETA